MAKKEEIPLPRHAGFFKELLFLPVSKSKEGIYLLHDRFLYGDIYFRIFREYTGKSKKEFLVDNAGKIDFKSNIGREFLWFVEHFVEREYCPVFFINRNLSLTSRFNGFLLPYLEYALDSEKAISGICGGDIVQGRDNPIFRLLDRFNLYLYYISKVDENFPRFDMGIAQYTGYSKVLKDVYIFPYNGEKDIWSVTESTLLRYELEKIFRRLYERSEGRRLSSQNLEILIP